MKRRFIISDGEFEVVLVDVSASDLQRIESHLEGFAAATPHNNKSLVQLLQDAVKARRISGEIFERLSVWCDTNQPPKGISDVAQDLARTLFGEVPPRLRSTGTKRVDGYVTKMGSFLARFL